MLSIKVITALAATLLFSALPPLTSAQSVCNRGAVSNNICLATCSGQGIYVNSPALVEAMSISNFQLDFVRGNPYAPLATSKGVKVRVSIPDTLSAVKLQFNGAGYSIGVGAPGGNLVANIDLNSYGAASGDSGSKEINLDIEKVPMTVRNGDEGGFRDFLRRVTLTEGTFNMRLAGYANTKAIASSNTNENTDLSTDLCLEYVGFDTTSALSGFGGLKDTKVINNGNNPRVVGGSDRGVELSIDLELNNPSNVILNANADAEFDLLYNNVNCGVVILPNVAVNPGRNRLTARSFARGAEANAACGQMLERFTGGTDISVGVANGRAPDMPSLDGAFGALNLPQQLPANKVPLINSATLIISELNILRLETESRINAANPFDAVVDITRIVADIKDRRSGTTIGKIDQGVSGFRLPSKGSADSPALNTKLILNFAAARALLGALGGSIPITVDSVLTVRFGNYETTIRYVQNVDARLTL